MDMELKALRKLIEVGRSELTLEEINAVEGAAYILGRIEEVLNNTTELVKNVKIYQECMTIENTALKTQVVKDQETIRYLKERVGLLERTLEANTK